MRRWDPFRDLAVLQDKINQAFNEQYVQSDSEAVSTKAWAPLVDIFESTDELIVRAEIPGVSKDDIEIEVTTELLSIKGERKLCETDKTEFVRMERKYGPFQRSFNIGVPIQPDKVKAAYKDGILELIIPKAEEVKPKKITINAE